MPDLCLTGQPILYVEMDECKRPMQTRVSAQQSTIATLRNGVAQAGCACDGVESAVALLLFDELRSRRAGSLCGNKWLASCGVDS